MILKFLNEPEANKNLKTSKEQKEEPALILQMPNPGFIPKPFDVSEFRSNFRHSQEGDTLEFEVSFGIQPLLGVGKVVNWA